MFRRSEERREGGSHPLEKVDSVLGAGIAWQGSITGTGGVRIDGAFDGNVAVRGLVVIGPQGRVTAEEIRAVTVIVAGSVRGNIIAERVEILGSGRVWGDVVAVSFSTEEGAFLRGRITMEEQIDLKLGQEPEEAPVAEEEGDQD
jgi:cytoskeletal protein CcmA (bactofilin family)